MSTTAAHGAPDPLLTVKQLAAREGLAERFVRRLIDREGLPVVRMQSTRRGPRGIRIRWSEYQSWLDGRRT